jgi:hypothetical protein
VLIPCIPIYPTIIVLEICALLGYYAALSGSSVPTFRDNRSVLPTREAFFFDFLAHGDGTDRLSQNVGKNYSSTLLIFQRNTDVIYIAAEV